MAQPVVLIIFSCQSGDTEKVALAAAVGAIQGRALIRLRRLPDPEGSSLTDTLTRMRKEYVPPTEKDIAGADVVILASSENSNASSVPWSSFLPLVRGLHQDGKLTGKICTSIGGIAPMMTDMDFSPAEIMMTDPVALGRSLADKVRAARSA